MRRLLTASALFTLALLATATGQPQPGQPGHQPKTAEDKKTDKKADKKPVDPTDAAVAAALANDPDVRMAKAKIQLAEAELAKARQAVTFKVVSLKSKIDQLKVELRAAEDRLTLTTQMFQRATVPQSELLTARDRVEAAKTALALAETEWKLLTGGGGGAIGFEAIPGDPHDRSVATALDWLARHATDKADTANAQYSAEMLRLIAAGYQAYQAKHAIKGPVPERLRTALDKPVKLGAKGEKISFEKALEVFKKEAGLDVPVRGTYPKRPGLTAQMPDQTIEVVSEGEELPVGAWFQLFEDNAVFRRFDEAATRYRFYVREYGLLISSADSSPPDAPSLTEFWKQKPPAKESKDPKAEAPPK